MQFTMNKLYIFLTSIFISSFAFSQVTIQVKLQSVSVLGNVDCDGFLGGDSDFGFEYRATDNSPAANTNNNSVTGLIGSCNYAIVNGNNGPYVFNSPNAVFSPTTGVFFNHTYFCKSALPTQLTLTSLAYESDDVMPAASFSLAEGIANQGNTVITFSVPPTSTVQLVTVNLTSTVGCVQSYQMVYEISYTVGSNNILSIDDVEGTTICTGATNGFVEVYELNATGTALLDWSNDGLGDFDDEHFADNLLPGTYTIQVKDDNNCVETATVAVTTQDPPAALAAFTNSTSVLCAGTNSVVYSVPNETGVIYHWDFNGVGSNTSGNGTNTVSMDFNSSASNGTLSVYAQNSCSVTPTITLAITVNALPTLTITGNNAICSNSTDVLTVSGANTYTWSTGSFSPTTVINPSVTTVYTVTGQSTQNCVSSKSFTVESLPSPTVQITTPSATICANQTITLNAVGSSTLFIWSDGVISSSNTVTGYSSMEYMVTNTYSNNCFAQATYSLHVLPAPSLTVTGDVEACTSNTISLTVSGADTYTWSTSEQTNQIIYLPSGNTTLSVSATNTLTGCQGIKTFTVGNYITNPISVLGNTFVCSGAIETFTAQGFDFYEWTDGSPLAVRDLSISVTTTIQVKGINATGCMDSTIVTIQAANQPTVEILGDNSICEGQTTSLSVNLTGVTSYSWSTGETAITITITPTSTEIYTLTAFNGPCITQTEFTVAVNEIPTVNFPPVRALCDNELALSLNALPSGGTFIGVGVTGNTFDPSVGVGEYPITYQFTSTEGCSASQTQTVVVESCVGINEFNNNQFIKVYPNPANSFINIQSTKLISMLQIIDVTGRVALSSNINGFNEIQLGINDLENGIYFIDLKFSDNSDLKTKFIKE
jgi:hypothetical protein